MNLAFSGTRQGMSQLQHKAVTGWLTQQVPFITEIHHGCCVGADVDFHRICIQLGLVELMQLHPSNSKFTNKLLDLESTGSVEKIWPRDDPLARDQRMVQLCDTLLITPISDDEVVRSGTWTTKRMALKLRRRVIHVRLHGAIEELTIV